MLEFRHEISCRKEKTFEYAVFFVVARVRHQVQRKPEPDRAGLPHSWPGNPAHCQATG